MPVAGHAETGRLTVTVNVRSSETDKSPGSVAVTCTFAEKTADGSPLITPVEGSSPNPSGSVEELKVSGSPSGSAKYGDTSKEKLAPTVPLRSGSGLTSTGAELGNPLAYGWRLSVEPSGNGTMVRLNIEKREPKLPVP